MLDLQVTRIFREKLSTKQDKEVDTSDLTEQVQGIVKRCKVRNGLVHVFVPGSTAAIIAIQYEDGLLQDLKETLRRIAPRDLQYNHQRIWRNDNTHSQLRATLLGPDMTVPISDGKLDLGTWQQIAVVNLDSQPREREVIVTVMGD
jgi:secondary thiamine-phosphate synthase enzyme